MKFRAIGELLVRAGIPVAIPLLVCPLIRGGEIQPLDIKPGLWEVIRAGKAAGSPPLRSARHCLKKEQLNGALNFGDEGKSCQRTIIASSRAKQEGRMECVHEGVKQSGTWEVEAPDSEHVQGSLHLTADRGVRSINVDFTFTGKWIGAACTEFHPPHNN